MHQNIAVGEGSAASLGSRLKIFLYAVDDLLIDAGPKNLAGDILAFAARQRLDRVVLTHLHEDHYGTAGDLQTRFNLPVFIHPMSVPLASDPPDFPDYRKVSWGVPDPFIAKPLGSTVETERYRFQVIETPGHADDHIVLYEPNQGWLFSGDLYLAPKIRIVMRQESMPVLMESLRRVLKLDFDTIFCGHAGVVPGGKHLLQQKLNHLEELQATVLDLYHKGWNLRQITRHLFPRRPPIYYRSRGEWSSIHIVRTLLPL
jgi:glyoxylase-like metal-dependent hydrolase (beta-lactamase superfamily II)